MTEINKRPTFLTVLCILSFIGLGFGIMSNIIGLLFSKGMDAVSGIAEEGMDQALTEIESDAPAMGSFMESIFGGAKQAMEHYTLITSVSLICSIIALVGVIYIFS
jgi:hypothetical protein